MPASFGVRGRSVRRAPGDAAPGRLGLRLSSGQSGGLLDAGVGLTVTALLLAGLARPGFPLLRDWVATPDPPLSDAALGLGESAARAVPQDVAMAWASSALSALGLPVWPLTGLLTAVFCVWLAVAAGALVRLVIPEADGTSVGRAGAAFMLRMPAVVCSVWNPFVVERLLQGHWSLLAGVAAVMTMPVLLARARVSEQESAQDREDAGRRNSDKPRNTDSLRIAGACAALASAGLTPTGWVLAMVAAAVALSCAGAPAARKIRAAAALTATAVVTALPWLLATVLNGPATGAPGQTGVTAFAARAEPGIGMVGSVIALGGIWNSQAVPPSRATWWAAVALALLLVVWALAARGLWRARRLPAVRATVPTAIVTWLVVALAATGPGLAALDDLVSAVPGAGLLRDTQKFVALALPATVIAVAFATRVLAAYVRPVGAALLATAVVVVAVPDAPRALWAQLEPVTYGPGWSEVAAIVDGQPGDLLVLPAGTFRSTPLWAEGRAVLDPAPRLLDTHVLVPGDLVVGGAGQGAVSGEGERARQATQALLAGEDAQRLTESGVRWVLDERTSAGPRGESAQTLSGATERFSDPELILYELPPPAGAGWTESSSTEGTETRPTEPSDTARAAVLAAHALWLTTLAGTLAGALAVALIGRWRRGPARH